jgi:hypothetical protein
MKHPIQKVYEDEQGTMRFVENPIVRYLLEMGPFDLVHLAKVFQNNREDAEQFAQLIGYSLSGFSELSYVSDEAYELSQTAQQDEIDRLRGIS